jgi:Dyp-type peroxidase family
VPSDSLLEESNLSADGLPLDEIQGNILQPHDRRHAMYLFIRFDGEAHSIGEYLGRLGRSRVTTAAVERHSRERQAAPFLSVMLTRGGFDRIGESGPPCPAFAAGMRARMSRLNDPPVREWQPTWANERVDALFLLADNDREALESNALVLREESLRAGLSVRFAERGTVLPGPAGAVEHFGYSDGLSQPRFFADELQAGRHWSARAHPDLVLIAEQGEQRSFGSYFVFRKLEQNVLAWTRAVEAEARQRGADVDTVAAALVGRFKDGSPVALFDSPQGDVPPVEDFNYALDPRGERCPFRSHVRLMNPRASPGAGAKGPDRRIARRGMTYGLRPDLRRPRAFDPPSSGVGLLFGCYQSSIAEQFEYLQCLANGTVDSERDCLIGQPSGGDGSRSFPKVTTLLGGEYFYAPSIALLRKLSEIADPF